MRVLLTTDTVGGVWSFTAELTQQLLAMGHHVGLVSFGRAASATQSAWAGALTNSKPERFVFHASDVPLEWMQDNAATWHKGSEWLMHCAKEFGADILHSSQFCWGALPFDMPKLITTHSDVRSWASACRKDLTPSPWLNRYTRLVQEGICGADAMVAPTEWMRDALLTHYESPTPLHVISNGRTIIGGGHKQKRKLQAVSVGRLWDEGKGLAILSEIASAMPVVLAGEPCFEGSAVRGPMPNVVELGVLDEKRLFDLFRRSSVYLAASLYEPFGLAPLEAALCGCAIVARDLRSLHEVWGNAALYYKDARELEKILAGLSQNSDALNKARSAAHKRALRFTGHRMAQSYAALYRRLIEGASTGLLATKKELNAA